MDALDSENLVGGLCLVLALVNGWRLWTALRAGEVPLYRTRLRRAETTGAKFATLLAINVGLTALLLVIAADLILGLELRGH